MALRPKQELFAREYLVDLNATQAAIRAGYSAKTAGQIGHELLKKPDTQAFLSAHLQPRAQKLEISAERVINELARISFLDPRKAASWRTVDILEELEHTPKRKLGRPKKIRVSQLELVDSDKLDDDTAAAISGVKQGQHGVELRFHDKRAALVDLGRHLGVFKETVDITIPVTFVVERTHRSKRRDEDAA